MEEMEGYLLYLRHAAGSTSDSLRPHLVVGTERIVRLHRAGANPFAEMEQRPLHGKRCCVQGSWDEAARVFLIRDITPLGELEKMA